MDRDAPQPSPARAAASPDTAGAVAHDINNLLQVILGCCDKLRAGGTLPEASRTELDHITIAAEHATALAGRMLPRGDRRARERRTIDLRETLERLRGLLRRVAGEAVDLAVAVPPDGTGVRIPEGDLAQVLVNLAVNARDAMPSGGRLTIDSRCIVIGASAADDRDLASGEYVELDVIDTGAGMSAGVRERAFDRFFTTKGSEGSGHGLATVRAIVAAHGGRVDVHSEPGRGTQFTILLPRFELTPSSETVPPAPRARPGEVVLVVDDEPMAREVLLTFLQTLGYATREAASARAALPIALDAGQPVDLVVADVTMPEMSGIELVERMRAAGSTVPALLVSGDIADAVLPVSGVPAAFLQKPFTTGDLAPVVRQLLDGSGAGSSIAPDAVRIDRLVEVLPAPVFIVQGGRFAYVNAAFASLLGLTPADLTGRSSTERVHPDDRSLLPAAPESTPAAPVRPSTTQVRVRCGDGAERTFVVTTVPIGHEGVPGLLGTASDVTLQPDALNVAVRMAALGRLAGGVAHDYNNLLLVIGGHIERLQRKLPADVDARHDVEAIAAAATRAGTLTDKLLSFGRAQMLAPELQDVGALVETVAAELRSSVAPAIALRVERDATVPPIEADRSRLREVLWHLVDNAREAMPDGGTLTVTVDAIEVDAALQGRWSFLQRGAPFVRLRVIDTGRGMEPDVAAHAFEPFFTTKGKGRGAGMGLASVYGIVKQSGGYVLAERAGSRGTCMTVLLPPASVRRPAAGEARGLSSHAHHGASQPRNRILLVEDDRGVREILEDLLRGHGFEVHAEPSAEDALAYAASHDFDLLLSDVDLPGMNGARLAAKLSDRHPGLRIILMSGYPDDGTIDGALAVRPVFLSKPFRSPVLLEHVRMALEANGGSAGAPRA